MSKWSGLLNMEGALKSKRRWALKSIFGLKGGPDMAHEPQHGTSAAKPATQFSSLIKK